MYLGCIEKFSDANVYSFATASSTVFIFLKRINVNYYEKGIKFLLLTEGKEKNDEHIK